MPEVTRRKFFTGALESAAAVSVGTAVMVKASTAAGTPRARVTLHKGVPTLFVDDSPLPAYMYFCAKPNTKFVADFAKAGIRIITWGNGARIPHSSDMGWKGPGESDYAELDSEVQTILDGHPDAYLIPRIAVSAPARWLEANPDHWMRWEDGTPAARGRARPMPSTSMASKLWLRDASDALVRYIRHVQSMPFSRNFIGYQITGGYNEWFYAERNVDFSPAALQGFREWLKVKYANDAAVLREAWRRSDVHFGNATLPPRHVRAKTDVNLFRNPLVSRWVSDYYEFLSEVNTDALIHLSKVGKEATRNQSLIGAFYGYLMCGAANPDGGETSAAWGHQALRKVLECPSIDFLASPYDYTLRGPGGVDVDQGPPECARLRGKIFITEYDTATYVAGPKAANSGGRPTPTRAQSFAIQLRNFSHRFIKRQGLWWMDITTRGGWYHDADIVKFLTRTRRLFDKAAALDLHYQPEVAVITDEETPYYMYGGSELRYPMVTLQDIFGLSRMGTTYDYYLHNDLSHPRMPDCKLYIFLDAQYLTDAERQAVKEKLRKSNKVVLWVYAPGVINEREFSAAHVRDLTGLEIEYLVTGHNEQLSSRVYITDYTHPITGGLESGATYGTESRLGPTFYCTDPQARVLGRLAPWHAEGVGAKPGLVVKEYGDWRSVYSAVPQLPPRILRNIARYAGCHIYNDDNDVIFANSHFLAIHTDKGGRKQIRLRRTSDVSDAFTEALVARDATEFMDDLPAGTTRLYYLGNLSEISDPGSRFAI